MHKRAHFDYTEMSSASGFYGNCIHSVDKYCTVFKPKLQKGTAVLKWLEELDWALNGAEFKCISGGESSAIQTDLQRSFENTWENLNLTKLLIETVITKTEK